MTGEATTATCTFGVSGLATMGANLVRNLARHGVAVAAHNRTTARTDALVREHGDEGSITPAAELSDLAAALERPRRIMVMVAAGQPVDDVLEQLVPHLDGGDLVIDGGNSRFADTQRRGADFAARGLRYLGVGVSGGEAGVLKGPSMMVGGDPDGWDLVADVLPSIAAEIDGTPCCAYLGPDGAGHYVKMVHNGIEYAVMQSIAEAYDLLRTQAGMDPESIVEVFRRWSSGEDASFLLETAATVLATVDEETGAPLVDVILDEAEQKGTGRWTGQDALELGLPATTILDSVLARSLSGQRDVRVRAAGTLQGPSPSAGAGESALVDDLRHALRAATVVAYAQGFEQLAAASEEHGWNLDLETVATIWRGGCIIRSALLEPIRATFAADETLPTLLLDDRFAATMAEAQDPWRRTIGGAVSSGIAVPALSSALAYYDGLRRERGPAALIQGIRDSFGNHGFRRTDRDGTFHDPFDRSD